MAARNFIHDSKESPRDQLLLLREMLRAGPGASLQPGVKSAANDTIKCLGTAQPLLISRAEKAEPGPGWCQDAGKGGRDALPGIIEVGKRELSREFPSRQRLKETHRGILNI